MITWIKLLVPVSSSCSGETMVVMLNDEVPLHHQLLPEAWMLSTSTDWYSICSYVPPLWPRPQLKLVKNSRQAWRCLFWWLCIKAQHILLVNFKYALAKFRRAWLFPDPRPPENPAAALMFLGHLGHQFRRDVQFLAIFSPLDDCPRCVSWFIKHLGVLKFLNFIYSINQRHLMIAATPPGGRALMQQ